MRKKLLLFLLISISFLFSINYVFAEEENIEESEDKQKEVVETEQSSFVVPDIVSDNVIDNDNVPDDSSSNANTTQTVVEEENDLITDEEQIDSSASEAIVEDSQVDVEENIEHQNNNPIINNDSNQNNNDDNNYDVIFNYDELNFFINGGSRTKLSTILRQLEVDVDINDVSAVISSDPSLLYVQKEGNDFTVNSLKSFDTNESLVLILNDGTKVVIEITDPAGDKPNHEKKLEDNGDGTYTLSLTVTGESERKPNNVNVIVVLDISGSMNDNTGNGEVTYTPTNSTGNGLYGYVNNQYVELTRYNFWGSISYWYNGQQYTGQRYIREEANQTRLEAAQGAVNSLAEALLSNNGQNGNPDDTVEIALITFSTKAAIAKTPTTSYSEFSSTVNSLTATGGTNWEDALKKVSDVNFGDTNPTYVIFVSDGNPTFRNTKGDYRPMDDYWYSGHYSDGVWISGVYGNGSDRNTIDGIAPETTIERCYDHAKDDAKAIVTGGKKFYTIGAYGTVDRMQSLTTYAGAPAGNYYSATNTTALKEALNSILAEIELAGFSNAAIDDGTTSYVAHEATSDISHLLDVDTSSFKYYKIKDGVASTWDDAPEATLNSKGHVVWDLTEVGLLENGVTYKVTFVVWPSQETLDLIADLKNDPSLYNRLDENIRKYLIPDGNGGYTLLTNTSATLSFTDTRPGGLSGSTLYEEPDPVVTESSELMTISKTWSGEKEEDVDVWVTRDGQKWYKVAMSDNEDGSQNGSANIALGTITEHDGKVEVLTPGHEYTFAESGENAYHWEIKAETVRPMLINGVPTILVLVDKAPTDGTKYYIIDGKYYTVKTLTNNELIIEATNEQRSNLDIVKVVTGDAPKDDTFTFTIKVTSARSVNPDDKYIWFSVANTATGSWDPVPVTVTGATEEIKDGVATHYYYVPSGLVFDKDGKLISMGEGTEFTVQMKAGYSLRIRNVLSGSKYSVAETVPSNYALVISTTTGTEFEEETSNSVSGKIKTTQNDFNITFTNDYQLTSVSVLKVWDDKNNQDGKRPESITITLSNGDTVTLSEANNWTATISNLPKYNNGQLISYTWSETSVPTGYTLSGNSTEGTLTTITNTHEPKTRDISVEKTWDDKDDYNKLRPDSVTITLFADGDEVETIKLDESNEWKHVFEKLPYYNNGVEIEYTIDEEKVPEYETEITGDMDEGFTVINFYSGTGGEDIPPIDDNPNTADSIYVYIAMMIVSLLGLIKVSYVYIKK